MSWQGPEARRGVASVEFAVVLPVLILLALGMMEFSRAMTVQRVLANASREAARQAILDGASVTDIEDRIHGYLAASNIDSQTISYTVNGAGVGDPTSEAVSGDAIGVEISVPFDDVRWLPVPGYIGGTILRAESFMRRESPP